MTLTDPILIYKELLSSLKLYLAQEHSETDKILVDSENYRYFQNYMQTRPTIQNHPNPTPSAKISHAPLSIKSSESQASNTTTTSSLQKKDAPAPFSANESALKAKQTTQTPTKPPEPASMPATRGKTLKLEPLKGVSASTPESINKENPSFREMRQFFTTTFPQIPLVDKIASDEEAKKISNRWARPMSYEIFILSFNETAREKVFLSNLATAISRMLLPATVLSISKLGLEKSAERLLKEKGLKGVIANHCNLQNIPELMKHYREEPSSGKHYLGNTRLLLLSDISLYMREPHLKSSLWHTLCQIFSPVKT